MIHKEKYRLKEEELNHFREKYQELFNDKWYPDFFFNSSYSLFYYKFPYIPLEKKKRIAEEKNNFQISGINVLLKRGASSYINWNIFVEEILKYYNDQKFYFKAVDFMAEGSEERYSISNQDMREILRNNDIKDFYDDISMYCMDDGFVMFGSSTGWAYYSGEYIYNNRGMNEEDYVEFDAFIFRKDNEQQFLHILQKSIKGSFKIQRIYNPTIFKDMSILENRVCEIAIDFVPEKYILKN